MSTVVGGGGDATLEGALERMRLDGAIFFRSEFTECWSYESPAELAGLLRPGAEEAFSRAFKRDHGTSPSVWRLSRRTAP